MSTDGMAEQVARELLAGIREGLLNAERLLAELIAGRGWAVLGYVSFQEMWAEELADIRLATDAMRSAVVYALLAEDLSDEQVLDALGGRVGDEAVAALRRQRANGVPPHLASTRVRAHRRNLPHQPTDFRIRLTPDERANWKAAIEAHGHNVEDWMVRVLRREVVKLEKSGMRR